MSDYIFDEPMPSPSPQEIWRSDKHASRNDPGTHARDENSKIPIVREDLRPDLFGPLSRLCAGAHLRHPIKLEQRGEIGSHGKPGVGHRDLLAQSGLHSILLVGNIDGPLRA